DRRRRHRRGHARDHAVGAAARWFHGGSYRAVRALPRGGRAPQDGRERSRALRVRCRLTARVLSVDPVWPMRTITLGFACNNACVFCAQGEARHERPAAIGAEVARALDEITPGETVALLGGEPTIFADLPSWIRAADARGAAHIVVQTNGRRLAYRAYARSLREASTKLSLDVSLHGSTPAMHDWHTATPGSFAQTLQGLRNAHAEGV